MATKRSAEVAQMIVNAEFGNESDIEDLSDEDDVETLQEVVEVEDAVVEVGIDKSSSDEEAENEELVSNKRKKAQPVCKKVSWVKKRFVSFAALEANEDMPLSEPLTPYSYSKEFISDSLLVEFSEKTNMYYSISKTQEKT